MAITNPITKNNLKVFSETYWILNYEDSLKYEYFSNSLIFWKVSWWESSNLEDLEYISTWKEYWIDWLIIMINSKIVYDLEDFNDDKYWDVNFIFTQVKTWGFDTWEFLKFIDAVKWYFNFESNDNKLVNNIFDNSKKFRKNPTLELFYIWLNKQDYNIEKHKKAFDDMNLFSNISIQIYWEWDLNSMNKKIEMWTEVKIKFEKLLSPKKWNEIDNVIFWIINFSEFKKLLVDENNRLNTTVFYENIRDYLWENEISENIKNTLKSTTKDLFHIFNNGITVVADLITQTWDEAVLKNYQIVNWCQTSKTLINIENSESDLDLNDLWLFIKVVSTNNSNIKDNIIIANNSQNEVKKEQLLATSKFQKDLEDYYNSMSCWVVYERRTWQYPIWIQKQKIINIPNQIKSYFSMFLEKPHEVWWRYWSVIKKISEEKIFLDSHELWLYYLSWYSFSLLEQLFSKKEIWKEWRTAKSHLLLISKKIVEKEKNLILSWQDKTKKSKTYIDLYNNYLQENYKEIFIRSIEIMESLKWTKDYQDYMKYIKNSQSTKDILIFKY